MLDRQVDTAGRRTGRSRGAATCVAAVLAFVLAAITIPHGAAAAEPRVVSANADAQDRLDGRTLARGLFFLTGPGVDLIPEVAEARDVAAAAGYTPDSGIENRVFDEMEALHPGVFDELVDDVYSGDHVRVREALVRSSDLVVDAAETVLGGSGESEVGSRVYLGLFVVMAAASVAWLAVGVSVVVAGMTWVVNSRADRDSVSHDQIVSSIVRHLG